MLAFNVRMRQCVQVQVAWGSYINISSGVFEPHLSDHSLVYAIIRASAQSLRCRKILCRSFKNCNKDEFANNLVVTPFYVASIFDDVDDQDWAFTKLLTDVIDIHAPVNQFHVRGGHVPQK